MTGENIPESYALCIEKLTRICSIETEGDTMCFDRLAALGREFDAAVKAIEEFKTIGIADDARMDSLLAKQDEIAERIIAAPALTPMHVAIKARVAMLVCRPTGDAIEERAVRELISAVAKLAESTGTT